MARLLDWVKTGRILGVVLGQRAFGQCGIAIVPVGQVQQHHVVLGELVLHVAAIRCSVERCQVNLHLVTVRIVIFGLCDFCCIQSGCDLVKRHLRAGHALHRVQHVVPRDRDVVQQRAAPLGVRV